MALINVAAREIHCKIVYYGPGLCGKTTNLKYIHSAVPGHAKGDLLSIATETERTLFFDFLPLDLGQVHGFQTRFHLYTVPGQVLYERTRVAVLNGADGVVFVADSQQNKLRENIQSLQELARNIQAQGKKFLEFPLVLQYNKRDMPNAVPVEILDHYLNSSIKVPRFEAIASKGDGVFDTLKSISKLVISKL
ncbi:MAG: gliding-motility protein MglA [Chloroflexi bacterium]|jgi:signal recognition particle receptor subunit beta|uniref:ADP-ribosylation factor-like protein n=1 Tax=Candidatus Chlorohelix allophototropha TaxID=3003348 RepID=A0A8T7LXM9_9CHLR|nr:gliding-motility protein MglA [Chloroflexota bacterium]WJW66853.1 ADP-ribosylation factor-like protein [Chloroflexota bacterium L227-S17]